MLDFQSIALELDRISEYEKRIQGLHQLGYQTNNIEQTIDECINNISDGINSFVIYGEPQCGKTELMIALTAKLLDEDKKIIIDLYQSVCDWYEEFLRTNDAKILINCFNKKFGDTNISDTKKVDLVLWQMR